jgi:hypothetical protein
MDSFTSENLDFELVKDINVELLLFNFDFVLNDDINMSVLLDKSVFFDFELDLSNQTIKSNYLY